MPPDSSSSESSGVACLDMPAYCFDVLIAQLEGKKTPSPYPSIHRDKYPLFVTWKKGADHRLRGCIGTFSPLALTEGLREYALTSALHDSRFDPVSIHEVPQLTCGVSLLVNFEPAANYLDWQIGVHGIRIHFEYNGRQRDAVFLPEVAAEQGWDHVETLEHLIRKSGHRDPIDERLRLSVRVTRFQSSKANLGYEEYRRTYKA